MRKYDYIVVGGGTAGCVLAARLSEEPDARVLLLEAGAADGPPAMRVPSAWPTLGGTVVDWGFTTVPQIALGGAVLPYPRGRVLGGSSAINAMAHIRAYRSTYDQWAADGADGWSYADLLPYFRRSETVDGRDPDFRGTDGPMRIEAISVRHPAAVDCLAAFRECGHPVTEDLNGAEQEGACWYDRNIVDGGRQSAADAYLRPVLGRPNLTVRTDALVLRLTFAGDRCTGVEYVHPGDAGEVHKVEAGVETILSAGAIGSPHLLQLSGIGPSDALRIHGITVVADLPAVGANLADHPIGGVVYSAPGALPAGQNNHFDLLAALRSDPGLLAPDLHILFCDVPLVPPGFTGPEHGFTIEYTLLRPHSRGSVRLASSDPATAPLIDPAFLVDERDLAAMLSGLDLAREIGGARALAKWRKEELLPGSSVDTEASKRDFVLRTTGTYFHGVGTCRMGAGPDTVTGPELRVHGIDGLRVVDASIMPSIPASNTNATVLAIAERAADVIRGARA
ncbi:MAG TPA: GMC family oxidoreductase N-terminal domain-containing protein [Kribbella sp.]|jgi:choline dehydrogenase